MTPILLADGRRYEPVKLSTEEARALRFRTALNLSGHVVRFEVVDRIRGTRVRLEEATLVSASPSESVVEISLEPEDTVVAGPYLLHLSATDADGAPVAIPGGLLELIVTGPNRTLTLGYFEGQVASAVQAAAITTAALPVVEAGRDSALEAAVRAEAAMVRGEALADNTGVQAVFATRALANAALPVLASSTVVEVSSDETAGGLRWRYTVVAGAYALGVPLPVLAGDGRSPYRLTADAAAEIDTSAHASLAAAVAAVTTSVKRVRVRKGVPALAADVAVPAGVELVFDSGAVLDLGAHTLTLNETPPWTLRQHVTTSGAGRVAFAGAAEDCEVWADWFGARPGGAAADNSAGVALMLASAGVRQPIRFAAGDYALSQPVLFGVRDVYGVAASYEHRGDYGGSTYLNTARRHGTVLRTSVTSGIAFQHGDGTTSPGTGSMHHITIVGPGTGTTTGLKIDRSTEGLFERVSVLNCAVGFDLLGVQGSHFRECKAWGCGTGVRSFSDGGDGRTMASNSVTWTNLNLNACNVGVWADASNSPLHPTDPTGSTGGAGWLFIGGTFQGGSAATSTTRARSYEATIRTFRCNEWVFEGVWFEHQVTGDTVNNTGVGGGNMRFIACHFGGTRFINVVTTAAVSAGATSIPVAAVTHAGLAAGDELLPSGRTIRLFFPTSGSVTVTLTAPFLLGQTALTVSAVVLTGGVTEIPVGSDGGSTAALIAMTDVGNVHYLYCRATTAVRQIVPSAASPCGVAWSSGITVEDESGRTTTIGTEGATLRRLSFQQKGTSWSTMENAAIKVGIEAGVRYLLSVMDGTTQGLSMRLLSANRLGLYTMVSGVATLGVDLDPTYSAVLPAATTATASGTDAAMINSLKAEVAALRLHLKKLLPRLTDS